MPTIPGASSAQSADKPTALRWEIERAVLASDLPSPARLVALTLLTRTDAETAVIPGRYSPSLSTIAGDTGLNRASVARHLNVLESAGWVTRLRDLGRAHSDKQPTCYQLHAPASSVRLVAQGDQSQSSTSRTEQQGLVAQTNITSRTERHNQTRSRSNPDPKPTAADTIRAAFPDAAAAEIETAIEDIRTSRKPRDLDAYVRGMAAKGSLRLPCDRANLGTRHSEACRRGQSSSCGLDWCRCRCHLKAAGR